MARAGTAAVRPVAMNVEAGSPEVGLSPVWLLIVAGAILYGSLLPFDFHVPSGAMTLFAAIPTAWQPTSPPDIITNLLVYVPFGFAAALCTWRNRRVPLAAGVPVAVLLGAALSLGAETLQTTVALRVSSLTDVALNTVGAAAGALLGALVISAIDVARSASRFGNPSACFATAAAILTVGLLLYGLIPFDFVTSSAGLHESFRRARWDLVAPRLSAPGDPPLAALTAQFVAAAWFAALGLVTTLARRARFRSAPFAWVAGAGHGVILACVIEMLQLFTHSHQFDVASMLLRSVAAVFGAWLAMTPHAWTLATLDATAFTLRARRTLFAVLAGVQVVVLLLPSFDPASLSLDRLGTAVVHWLPFEALWRRPFAAAAANGIAQFMSLAVLAVTVSIWFGLKRPLRGTIATALVVSGTAVAVEALQLCTISRHADLTGPAIALFAAFVGRRMHRSVAGSAWTRPSQPLPVCSLPVTAVFPS